MVVEQENETNLGGQAFWSLGGLFLVDSPEQRRMGVRDSDDDIERHVLARDREMANPYTKDLQIAALRAARLYRGGKLARVATPHRILDRKPAR